MVCVCVVAEQYTEVKKKNQILNGLVNFFIKLKKEY